MNQVPIAQGALGSSDDEDDEVEQTLVTDDMLHTKLNMTTKSNLQVTTCFHFTFISLLLNFITP